MVQFGMAVSGVWECTIEVHGTHEVIREPLFSVSLQLKIMFPMF